MELLRRLNNSFSASGYEDEIRAVVCEHLSKWYDVKVDVLGNVIATRGTEGKHFAFLAPMDTGGYYLNHQKCEGAYHCTKIARTSDTNLNGLLGCTFSGKKGTFAQEKDEILFLLDKEETTLPDVADIMVPFSVSEHRITARHADLYAMLLLAERLKDAPLTVSFVALAQTTHRRRGAYGTLPKEADLYVLIEQLENEKFRHGQGAILCLKDDRYLCPKVVKNNCAMFENRYVCEEKGTLASALACQDHGRLVASVKIPTSNIGTQNERFSLADVNDLCDKLVALCEKGLTKS